MTANNAEPAPQSSPFPNPEWTELDSVAPPVPEKGSAGGFAHPFDTSKRWQVALLGICLLVLLALAVVGWWQLTVWLLVALGLGAALFRLAHRRAWTRARSTVFDVAVLLGMSLALVIVMLILPR